MAVVDEANSAVYKRNLDLGLTYVHQDLSEHRFTLDYVNTTDNDSMAAMHTGNQGLLRQINMQFIQTNWSFGSQKYSNI